MLPPTGGGAPSLVYAAMVLAWSLLAPSVGFAVSISVGSATVLQPGDQADICVALDTGGQEVAGVQNDLVWDGTCSTLAEGACAVAGSHGKHLSSAFPPNTDFTYRAVLLSFTNVKPMPDGLLYCCTFIVDVTQPGACCNVGISNMLSSDPKGSPLPTRGISGRLCLTSEQAAGPSPSPTSEMAASSAPDSTSGNGCQLDRGAQRSGGGLWLAAPVLLCVVALRRKRRV